MTCYRAVTRLSMKHSVSERVRTRSLNHTGPRTLGELRIIDRQSNSAMAEPITIPISVFELSIQYSRPSLTIWLDRAVIVQKMFDAFAPWNVNVDDMEGINVGKPSEQGFKFKIPAKQITFFFGPAGCKFTKEAATWAEADDTLRVLSVGLDVLVKAVGVELGNRATSLALHLQPKGLSYRDLLRPFLPQSLGQLEKADVTAMAYVVRWIGRRVTLDGSAAIANGVFVHLERDFEPSVSFEEMKARIFNDEVAVLKLLNVEEVTA